MPQTLYTLASDGTSHLPILQRGLVLTLDNCALSMLLNEEEWRKCRRAMELRKYIRAKPAGSLVFCVGPAVLESTLLHTEVPLAGVLAKKTADLTRLAGGKACTEESLVQFAESVALTLTRYLALFLMLYEANRIYRLYANMALPEAQRAKRRVLDFLEWAQVPANRAIGAQTSAVMGIYCALAHNVDARTEFGIACSGQDFIAKLLNGAWDLLHLHDAITLPARHYFPKNCLLEPMSMFATADQGLARVFQRYEVHDQNLMHIVPSGFLEGRKMLDLVQQHLGDRWPHFRSPSAYAKHLTAVAAGTEHTIAASDEPGSREVRALLNRSLEAASLIKDRESFSLTE